MQDHPPAKVTLSGSAQYVREHASDFLTLEGSKNMLCIDTYSNSHNPLGVL